MANGSRSDSYILSQDATFQHRVQSSLLNYCSTVAAEGWAIPFHRERMNFVNTVLQTLGSSNSYVPMFAAIASTNATLLSDATVVGTVVLTTGNVTAQGLLVTDADIDNAVSSQFNSFIRAPAN